MFISTKEGRRDVVSWFVLITEADFTSICDVVGEVRQALLFGYYDWWSRV